MLQLLAQWNQRRRERRRSRRRNPFVGANGYPIDMAADSVATISRVKQFTMTTPERLNGLCEAVRYITSAEIEGDIVECGVWKGGSMMAVAEMLNRFGDQSRHLHLFDTFTGMSEPTEQDVSFRGEAASDTLRIEREENPSFQWCGSSLEEVRSHMLSTGYPQENIHLVPGMVEATIPDAAPGKIALLRLDTDWYESTRHEMEHLFPRLADGGVLIIDDYGHWEGARKAIDQYLANNNIAMMLNRLDYTGRIAIRHAAVTQTGQFKTADTSSQQRSAA